MAVRGQDVRAEDVPRTAVETRDAATGGEDEGGRGCRIPRGEPRVDVGVELTVRDAPEVGDGRAHAAEAAHTGVQQHHGDLGAERAIRRLLREVHADDRLRKLAGGAHRARDVRLAEQRGDIASPVREGDRAEHGLTFAHERDATGVVRDAMTEVLGPVERVHDPDGLMVAVAIEVPVRRLLGEDQVVGEVRGELLADEFVDREVGLGDGVVPVLHLDPQVVLPEEALQDLACGVDELVGGCEPCPHLGVVIGQSPYPP